MPSPRSAHWSTPADVLAELLRADAAAPRITCYDDATGERIELSAKVLANWVAKAANLLQDDFDAAPGTTVGLDLPAHWRSAYWALAAWSVGATVLVGPAAPDGDVVITTQAALAATATQNGRDAVLVTLAALARRNPDTPAGVIDEASELAGYPDTFAPLARPSAADPALRWDGGEAAYGELGAPGAKQGTRALAPTDLGPMLRAAVSVWRADGSIVLVHYAIGDQSRRLAAERVTLDMTEPL